MTEADASIFFNSVKGKQITWAAPGSQVITPHTYKGGGVFLCTKGSSWAVCHGFAPNNWTLVKEENNMTQVFKEYFSKHKDIFMTLAVVLLADHFVFKGAFRDKVKTLLENLLSGAEKKITALNKSDEKS